MSVLNENTLAGASAAGGEYEIEQSLRFDIDTVKWLKRTPTTTSNQKTWTLSMWHKRGAVGRNLNEILFKAGGTGGSGIIAMHLTSSTYSDQDKIWLSFDGATTSNPVTNRVFRDPSGWMHIVLRFDTTQATVTDRARLYINGELIISTDYSFLWSTSWAGITQNSDWNVNKSGIEHSFGAHQSNQPLDGYLADIAFVDGQSLGPDSFGETGTYGEWKPIAYAGTYGTNGFYLDFKASGSLGNDAAGSNNWTPNNLAATDQMLDSPTNNFCTLNPITQYQGTYSEGNLKIQTASTGSGFWYATFPVNSGKWYYEWQMTLDASNVGTGIGWAIQDGAQRMAYYSGNGYKYSQAGNLGSYGAAWAIGDIIGVAFNADNQSLTYYKNNVAQPTLSNALGTTGPYMPFGWDGSGSPVTQGIINFGSDSSFAGTKTPQGNQDSNGIGDFYYAPPTGFLALCTANLPEVDVIPSEHFNTVLYTGNSSTQSISTGLPQDLVWLKSRSSAAYYHTLFDTVRGPLKRLFSNTTGAEDTTANTLTAFNSDGFTLGSQGGQNAAGETFVAWNWKAGGTAVSNTDGTITSSVSANVDAGFSIVSYTGNGTSGATVGHGLSSAPEVVLIKYRDGVDNWTMLHTHIDLDTYLALNLTNAAIADPMFNNTAPTSSVFTIDSDGQVNTNTGTFIAYCFHSVESYSKVGSFVGNGSADGPFVHCGFKPKFVLVKRATETGSWFLFDTDRSPYNVMNAKLSAENSGAEESDTSWNIDFLSNGFKLRSSHVYMNSATNTHIFIAFAESPFKHSNAR